MTALKLQAGVMETGAAEAVAAEEHSIRCMLAALPPEKLPQLVRCQLQELGIQYGSGGAGAAAVDAAEDFELPEDDAVMLPGSDSTDARTRELAEMAAHFSSSSDLSYALQHKDELATSSAAAGDDHEGHAPGARLLSSSKAAADAADGQQQPGINADMLLHIDQEFELQFDDVHAPAAADVAQHNAGDNNAAGWGSSSSGSQHLGSVQWAGGLAGGKLNVLSALKCNRRPQMLPPSNRPLGKNAQIKPNLQVRLAWLLAPVQLGCCGAP
jgi:hypothetical protein